MEKENTKKLDVVETEGYLSIIGNTVLFVLKLYAGIVSNSVAIKADAWHTLSDSISSVIVIFAAKVSKKPADTAHPFGHGRAGLIASLFIGFLLVVIGFEFAKEGVLKFLNKETASFGILAIAVTVLSILVKEAMAQYAYWAYRKTNDESLRADGWHHRSDALSSGVMLIGILFGHKFWWADSVLSFAIAGLLGYAAYEIILKGINILLGHKPTEEFENSIDKMCRRILGETAGMHHLHVHFYGDHQEVTFHVRLDGNLDLSAVHEAVLVLEVAIREELNVESTIHVDPIP